MSSNKTPDEIRQNAFALLTRMGPEDEEDRNNWPAEPSPTRLSSYQHQTQPEMEQIKRAKEEDNNEGPRRVQYQQSSEKNYGVVGFVIKCISDACNESSNSAGYEAVKSVPKILAATGYEAVNATMKYYDESVSSSSEIKGSYDSVPILNTYQDNLDVPITTGQRSS